MDDTTFKYFKHEPKINITVSGTTAVRNLKNLDSNTNLNKKNSRKKASKNSSKKVKSQKRINIKGKKMTKKTKKKPQRGGKK